MTRLIGTIAAALLLCAGSLLTAQTVTSGNTSVSVATPASIQCSAPFSSTIALSGFDVQDPGVADIVLVLDESGSIPSASFAQMKTFATNLVTALMPVTNDGARVGIAMFASASRRIIPLTVNRQVAINAVNSITQSAGGTCIGCGITEGRNIFNTGPPRPEATQFMIVLTDGVNAVNTAQFPGIVSSAKAAGITMLAIGVGPNVDANQIRLISSDIPDVTTDFFTTDFNQLSTIIGALTAAIVSPGSTNVTVDIDVAPRFPVSSATATAGTVQVAGSSVLWTLPSLGSAARTLTLHHQHDGQGQGSLQVFAGDYTDAEGHAVTLPTPFTVVSGCNTAPVANAGPDQILPLSGTASTPVTLNGSATTDDGLVQPLSYSWSNQDGSITATGVSPTVTVPFGAHTFTLTVSDGEFTDIDEVLVALEDSTPPVVTSSATGPSHNGWFTGDVAVALTVTDPESGIASSTGCGPSTVTLDTVGQSFTCEATNGAGLTADASETVQRDATAPDLVISGPVTATATSASGAAVSYTNPSATDLTSGLNGAATCAPASGSPFALGETTVHCSATDKAGHTANGSFTVTVGDATPPVVSHTVAGTLGANGWYVSNIEVSFTTEDPETGVATSSGCAASTVSTNTAGQSFTCTATNGAGLTTIDTVTVKRDATAPSLTVSGPVTANPTSAAGAIVSYLAPTATDAMSGMNGGASCAPASGTMFSDGVTTVNCSAADNAGNIAARSFTVTISDTTPPVITSLSPSESSLWPPNHKMTPVTLSVLATDIVSSAVCAISNVTSSEPDNGQGDGDTANDIVVTGPLTVNLRAERSGNGSGRIYTINVRCTDAAGNAATRATIVSVAKSKGK